MIVVQPPVGRSLVNVGAIHCFDGTNASSPDALSQFTAQYLSIPSEIRSAFEKPVRSKVAVGGKTIGEVEQSLAIHIGTDHKGITALTRPGAGIIQGLFVYLAGTVLGPQGVPVITHEYGHHIDQTYHLLWPSSTSLQTRLTNETDFRDLYLASFPTIPVNNYSRTSPAEWFAELFGAQISQVPTAFVQAAGGDRTRATAIRKAFTDRLPMPPFTF